MLSHEDMPQMRSLLNSLGFSYSNIKYGLNKLTDNIYLLASQVDDSSEPIVLKRFQNMGLKCDVVESVG